MAKMSVLVAVAADRKVLLQISEDDRALGHINLDPEAARTVAGQLLNLADLAEGIARKKP